MTTPTQVNSLSPARAAFVDQRERVVQALAAHYAVDHLAMEEFEARLELAYDAGTAAQLEELIADLPQLDGPVESFAPPALLAPSSEVPQRAVVMAAFGGAERKGSWIVPRHLKVIAALGGAVVDLREARFGAGVTEIEVFAFMGGVEIIVPPGVRVECNSTAAVLGGYEIDAGDATALSALHPVVRLSGLVVFGGVDAKSRLPGESDKEAKARRKRARSEARRRRE